MNRKKRFTSIKTKIFLSYSSVILVLIILASSLYYFTAYYAFHRNYITSSRQLTKIVAGQVDQYLEQINILQKQILESDIIRDYIFQYALEGDASEDREFRKMIYMITGYEMLFHHMNILNLENSLLIPFGTRYDPVPYEINSSIQDNIIIPAVSLRGTKYILPTGKGTLYEADKNAETFSLIRSFPRYSNSLADSKGIIEMQISSDTIEKLVEEMLLSYDNKAESVYIFTEDKELIFPAGLSDELISYYSSLNTGEQTAFYNSITKQKELITSYHSLNTSLTTLIVTPEASLLSNRQFFINIGLLIAFISLFLLITITYRLAKSISSPIIALKDSISSLKLDEISEESIYRTESSMNEVEMLSSAYNHMQSRLKKSLNDIVQTKTLSIHSQIMALQAQMDSHFLYNTLTIISIIAEENNDLQVSEMCLKLTNMLRYITVDYTMTTTFREELLHAKNYTDLMKIRFGEKISFNYYTDSSLQGLSVPRLIIQPLIENCVKYSRDDNRILAVCIESYSEAGYWYTRITDTGPGFTEAAVQNIFSKIDKINADTKSPGLGDGMGMANIFLRLKLFYEDSFIFDIETPENGASVLIGGKITYDKK